MNTDVAELKRAAAGRWTDAQSQLGGIDAALLDGKHHACPRCGGKDRFRAFDDGSGGCICNQCFSTNNGDGIAVLQWLTGLDFTSTVSRLADFLGIKPSTNGNGKHQPTDPIELLARAKNVTVESLKVYGAKVDGRFVVFPEYDHQGNQCSTFKIRPDGSDKQRKGLNEKGKRAGLFLQHDADGKPILPKPGETVLMPEGVKDAAALHALGYLAIGLPGKQLGKGFARMFAGVDVVVIPDRDEAGELGSNNTASRLRGHAASVKICVLPSDFTKTDGADVRDVLRMPDGESLLRQAIADAQPWQPPTLEPTANGIPSIMSPDGRTEAANARRLAARFGDVIRWCEPWQKWLVWDSRRWAIDNQRRIDALAKELGADLWQDMATAALTAERETMLAMMAFCKASNNANGIKNMVALARSEPGIAILPNVLNRDPWKLTVENGTIDLRTGKLGPHDPADFITKLASVTYSIDADCPRWLQFLREVFGGNTNLIEFIRRAAGYSLTASTRERCLFFLHGKGRNGKSTFVTTLQKHVMGEYATGVTTEMLMVSKGQQHPTETCDLAGARMAVAVETEDSRRFAESFVKQITGGEDRLKGRRMREDFWEFDASFKLWISGNHKPDIRGTDDGIWDRMRLIPFNVRFDEPDRTLAAKLEAERSGILSWMISGCLEWQRDGLGTPQEVIAATNQYRADSDLLGMFIDRCCIVGPNYHAGASQLYQAYLDFGGNMTQHKFGAALTEREFSSDRYTAGPLRGKTRWNGIGLTTPDEV